MAHRESLALDEEEVDAMDRLLLSVFVFVSVLVLLVVVIASASLARRRKMDGPPYGMVARLALGGGGNPDVRPERCAKAA